MNKDQLFQELSAKISTGEISREEVASKFGFASQPSAPILNVPIKPKQEESTHYSLNRILYLVGAAIVVIGIVIFVGQIWDEIGSGGRVLVTLGLGLVFAGTGSVFLATKPEDKIGQVFHAIGGILIPSGAGVLLYEMHATGNWPMVTVFGILTVFYVLLTMVQKNVVLTLFSFANGTAFVYLFVNAMLSGQFYMHPDFYANLTMVMGVSYMLFGYAFTNTWNSKLSESLYALGSLGVLGAAYSKVFDSGVWQMLFFFIVLAGIYLSVLVKNRNILVLSTVFLVAHVSYITSKYFADSLGWPLSLILLGMIFIALGYASININKKYISS